MSTRLPRPLLAVLAAALLLPALLLSACGASKDTVAHIEGSSWSVSRAMLDHWMHAVVANDFRTSIGTKAPEGLASDPANPGECAEAAKKVIPRAYTGKLKLTDAQIATKCTQLNNAVRAQALGYLLSAQREFILAEEQGLHVTDAELRREFLRFQKEVFGDPQHYRKYLHERGMVLSDTLYQLRRNVLVTRMLPKTQAKVAALGGGTKTYGKIVYERYNRLVSKTSCKAGYVMEQCKGYKAPKVAPPSADLVIEQFVGGVHQHKNPS